MKRRQQGVLLHITSLPSRFGVGDVGPTAYKFVDLLKKQKQTHWQILPINPIEKKMQYSPYSSTSAFAGNPLFISPELLFEDKLLDKEDLFFDGTLNQSKVDYLKAEKFKTKIISKAYKKFLLREDLREGFTSFCELNKSWLLDFALFEVLSKKFKKPWVQWSTEYRNRNKKCLKAFQDKEKKSLEKVMFAQYLFFGQWRLLRKYCQKAKIKIIGDLPIYVQHNSVDVWVSPQVFELSKNKQMKYVAGVPPDYFSKTGQAWNVPVYNWKFLEKQQFEWWINRFDWNLKLFDQLRVDHFRGFINYWKIRKGDPATDGQWADVPTDEFFKRLKSVFVKLPIIAEDLGDMSWEVKEKIKSLGFPGMKILEFAFQKDLNDEYLPHRFERACVAYTGTHDNNTIRGWFKNEATPHELWNLSEYYGKRVTQRNVHKVMIESLIKSKADLVIIPMQDVLGLGVEARMNTPGTTKGNWLWHMKRFPSKV